MAPFLVFWLRFLAPSKNVRFFVYKEKKRRKGKEKESKGKRKEKNKEREQIRQTANEKHREKERKKETKQKRKGGEGMFFVVRLRFPRINNAKNDQMCHYSTLNGNRKVDQWCSLWPRLGACPPIFWKTFARESKKLDVPQRSAVITCNASSPQQLLDTYQDPPIQSFSDCFGQDTCHYCLTKGLIRLILIRDKGHPKENSTLPMST